MAISDIGKNALEVLERRYLGKDEDGNVVDITKPVTLYNTATQKLVFEFDEPIGVTAAGNKLPLNSKVFVDGNDITAVAAQIAGEFDKYADSNSR